MGTVPVGGSRGAEERKERARRGDGDFCSWLWPGLEKIRLASEIRMGRMPRRRVDHVESEPSHE